MAWLGEGLSEQEQDGRAVCPALREGRGGGAAVPLFARRRDLLTRLDLVFMDTTSLFFEGPQRRAADHLHHQCNRGAELKAASRRQDQGTFSL